MSPEPGRGALRIAVYCTATAAVLLLLLPAGSPEFAITVITLLIGLLFTAVVWVVTRRQAK